MPANRPIESGATAEARSPAQVVAAAKQVLATAQRGLADINSGDPTRLVPGLHNVAVFGRAVTIALQRLRHIAEGFDDWYKNKMPTKDPLLGYMNKVRNQVLKEAESPKLINMSHVELSAGDPNRLLQGQPPAGATSVFIGDRLGGSGWIVKLPDGTEQKYYAALSSEFRGEVTMHLPDAPNLFLGNSYSDTTVAGVTGRYVSWLEKVVADAERRFT